MTANQSGEPWSRDGEECRIYSSVEWGVRQARLSVDVILEIWGKERRGGVRIGGGVSVPGLMN